MADKNISTRSDQSGASVHGKFRDENDGTFSAAERARLEGWDSVNAAWIKIAATTAGAIQTTSGAGGGGPATIANGADVAEGATTDLAVITDVAGTVSGKLRGLVKWAFERMPASLGQKTMAASLPVVLASDQTTLPVSEVPAGSIATATGTTGQAVTLTLAAVAAQFHCISLFQIVAYNTAARTGGATPVLVTTTNLTGSPVFTFASAGAIGATDIQTIQVSGGVRSTTANTATTVVCPATPSVIWRVNVIYRTET